MIALADIETRIEAIRAGAGTRPAADAAAELLRLGEAVLEHWVTARDETPTRATREGFRLLADPGFATTPRLLERVTAGQVGAVQPGPCRWFWGAPIMPARARHQRSC